MQTITSASKSIPDKEGKLFKYKTIDHGGMQSLDMPSTNNGNSIHGFHDQKPINQTPDLFMSKTNVRQSVMVSNKPNDLGNTMTLECDFVEDNMGSSPLRNEYYQMVPPVSIDQYNTLQNLAQGLSEPEHNQNHGCSGGTDVLSGPDQKEDSENPIHNLSDSIMKLAKKESHSMSDDGNDDLLDQSPLLTKTNDGVVYSSAI